MDFFDPSLAPFSIALMILGLIVLLEAGGLLFGIAFSGLVDSLFPEFGDLDLDAGPEMDGPAGGPVAVLLSWLCVGKVPILILLAAFLTGFGLSGLIVQSVINSVAGFYLPAFVAAFIALFVALPVTRHLGLLLARIMPSDTSDAVSSNSFVGRTAVIIRGVARANAPAEAKFKDSGGTTQYILVEPDQAEDEFPTGTEVLLTEKTGAVFRCIENTHSVLKTN